MEKNEKTQQAAQQFSTFILPNLGILRSMARLKGLNLKDYTDTELLIIIRDSCDLALKGLETFKFKPVYAS